MHGTDPAPDSGSPRHPGSQEGKLLLGLWLVAILILNTIFTGHFKALLTVDGFGDIIHTVKELAEKDAVLPIIPGDSIFEELFRGSEKEEYQKIYKRALANRNDCLIHSSRTATIETYQRMKDGKGVLVYNSVISKYYLGQFCSQLKGDRTTYYIDETFYPYPMALAVRYDFPNGIYAEINDRILRLKEAGLVERWTESSLQEFEKCQAQTKSGEETPLGMKHLVSVFYVFLFLEGTSILMCCGEIYCKRFGLKR